MNANRGIAQNLNFANYLHDQIREHQGWSALETFGECLEQQPLDERGLKVFLASTSCFFQEIPGGILALALRVTDDRISQDRFGAVQSAASVLLAAVDEYGLGANSTGNTRNHHLLFKDMVNRFGLNETELFAPELILPEATHLASITHDGYRDGSVAGSVGFHFASEVTSDREFELSYNGLARHLDTYTDAAANIAPERFLDFYFVHTVVEKEHGEASADTVNLYGESVIDQQAMLDSAEKFMDAYGAFWSAINRLWG